jgi:hypothetical protein
VEAEFDAQPAPAVGGPDYVVGEDKQAAEIGKLTRLSLTPLGNRPYKCPEVASAWWLLRSTHESITGLFDTLYLVRRVRASKKNQSTRGRLSGDAQDILRTAIVFTSAGLDACLTELLTQPVPVLATHNSTARAKFERYLELQVNEPRVTNDFRDALKDLNPRTRMVDLYISSLTKASFQGSSDIKDRARAALGVTNQQLPTKRITALDSFFAARNDVAHRMDHLGATRADTKPPRQQRRQEDVGLMCDQVLLLLRDLIKATATNLGTCPRDAP